MKTQSIILGVLAGAVAAMAGTNTAVALSFSSTPGVACQVTGANTPYREVSGTTFNQAWIRNLSNNTLRAICPLTMKPQTSYVSAEVYGSLALNTACLLRYQIGDSTSYANATVDQSTNWCRDKGFCWYFSSVPAGAKNFTMECPLPPNAVLYHYVLTSQ